MTTFVPISSYLSSTNSLQGDKLKTNKCFSSILSKPNKSLSFSTQKGVNFRIFREKRGANFELGKDKDGILNIGLKRMKKGVVLVRLKQGLGFNSNFHSFSRAKFGVFSGRLSNFDLGKDKDGILFNGLMSMKKRVVLVRFNQGFRFKSNFHYFPRRKGLNFGTFQLGKDKDEILFDGLKSMKKRVGLVRFSLGLNGGGGGGGGGGRNDNSSARVLGNLALAIGLTYLTMTNQLGWLLDAIVSVWLLAVILPVVGLGAFLWWAGRDIVQSSCPNCGNEFQIFRSVINDEMQLCPYCSQPFSVVGDEFVKDPVKFTSEANTFGEAFNDFFPRTKKEKKYSKAIVDVEAEVKDAE